MLSSGIVTESLQYFLPLSSLLTHRQTIRFFPLLVHVTRLYRLPHSPQIRTSESAYREYFPDDVILVFVDCGVSALRLLNSSWALLKTFRETDIAKAYGVNWIPSLVVIGPDGKVKLSTVMSSKVDQYLKNLVSSSK